MRVYAILGVAAGQEQTVLAALPNTVYRNGSDGQGERLEYSRNGEVYSLLVWRFRDENGPITVNLLGADWNIWLLAADSRDAPGGHWRWLTRAYRYLRRQSALHPGYLLGPFSLAEVRERWPVAAEALLDTDGAPSWPIIAGDNHAACETVDYRPTQQEIDEDTEADPVAIGLVDQPATAAVMEVIR